MFVIGLSVALPIFFGIVNKLIFYLDFVAKMMPKMNIFMVALPVKNLFRSFIIYNVIKPMYDQMQALFD